MGKKIKFTELGGFPLTQDQMAYLQEAWLERLRAIVELEGDGAVPFVISGCVVTRALNSGTLYDYTVTDGWVYYNGEMYFVQATTSPITVDESSDKLMFVISRSDSTLVYNDASTPTVVLDDYVNIVGLSTATAEDGTHFNWTSLKSDKWRSVAPNLATVWRDGTNPIVCSRQPGSNIVAVSGTSDTLGHFLGTNSIARKMATLPADCWPSKSIIKIVPITLGALGYAYIEIKANGEIWARGDILPHEERGMELEFTYSRK